jgi:3-phosphoshikimate 1-carboxyvinyltransferase
MLNELGVKISSNSHIIINPLDTDLKPFHVNIPGDPSSAAFFASAAALLPNSDLTIKNLLANSTRIGFFHVLEKMGAIVTWQNMRKEMGEIVGDVNIKSQPLSGIDLQGEIIPSIIDEIPIIALLATQADSPTCVRNAEELRHKESDRIDAICHNIKKMGIDIIEMKDGFIINPEKKLENADIKTFGDHRIAMVFSIAELLTSGKNSFDDLSCIDISFPNFFEILKKITI